MQRARIRRSATLFPALAAGILLAGCSGGTKVSRINTDSTVDLSGEWNDADSRMVSSDMVNDCLTRAWYPKYSAKGTPKVIVGEIRNKSHEHINTETFVNDIQKALINSGKVEFVASKGERDQLREEKEDQATHATQQTRKSQGEETGADLMMIGSINTIIDQEGGRSVRFYQVDLELVDLESHQKVWIGDKKIKKLVERPSTSL